MSRLGSSQIVTPSFTDPNHGEAVHGILNILLPQEEAMASGSVSLAIHLDGGGVYYQGRL